MFLKNACFLGYLLIVSCVVSIQSQSCKQDEFQCVATKKCIKQEKVCDGAVDCEDSSDDSFTLCSGQNFSCPAFAFRCSYGACVSGDAKCNGVYDCADWSDELLKECPEVVSKAENSNCLETEFACLSGEQCIANHRKCDGYTDCDDGTDETITECSQIACEPFAFRCAYGACVDGNFPCDGISQCRDGSDELAPHCPFKRPAQTPSPISVTVQPSANVPIFFNNQSVTERPGPVRRPTFSSKTCKLPPKPSNGNYLCERSLLCPGNAGSEVPGGFSLHYTCNQGFGLKGIPDITCRSDGVWSPQPPHCSDQCEPLISKKLRISCISSGLKPVRCDQPVPGNTHASFSCNPATYAKVKEPGYSRITCRNGNWEKPLIDDFCQPECGQPLSHLAQPVISAGKETEFGQFPWHAGIYRYNATIDKYEQICGGSLISNKVVVTAAHCLYFSKTGERGIFKTEESALKVALGKYYRDLYAKQDVMAQILDVQSYEKAPEYEGTLSVYEDDIAFMVLKTEVEYSLVVRPVCIDNSNEEDQLVKGAIGKVVGWGLTSEGVASETLLLAEMPYVPRDECKKKITFSLSQYVRKDKICGGDKNSSVSVCPGDSGGGYVFEDERLKAYYLRGVVSLGKKGCKGQEYALFTRISYFKDLVDKYLNL